MNEKKELQEETEKHKRKEKKWKRLPRKEKRKGHFFCHWMNDEMDGVLCVLLIPNKQKDEINNEKLNR